MRKTIFELVSGDISKFSEYEVVIGAETLVENLSQLGMFNPGF